MKRQLLTALFPLVLFWAIEEFWGLKAALIAGCIAAVAEILWEKITLKKVSFMTLVSNSLVLGLGAVSFFMQSGAAFKLQPAVMELGMAGFMGFIRFKGEPFMVHTFRELKGIDAQKKQWLLSHPFFLKKMNQLDLRLLFFLIAHGIVLGWAAIWGSTRLWILLKGVLFYVLLVLVVLPMYKRQSVRE